MDETIHEPTDATNQEEELDLELELGGTEEEDQSTEVDVESLQEKMKKTETFARQALARAKKAEEELKGLKEKPKETPKPTSQQPSIEETVLLANGMPEELIESLKKVAQVQGISLIKAQHDPIFVAIKEKAEKENKAKEASLPASRGSGVVKPKKDFKTPGLTEAERKAMFEERFNR